MRDGIQSFRNPRLFLPFCLVTLVWGSSWIVIKDQVGEVPPAWSITYRFILAAATMFAYAHFVKLPVRMERRDHLLAALFGVTQFFLNYIFVYTAEQHITSGVVAIVYAILLVPNTLLAAIFLGRTVPGRFIVGSTVAVAGVGLLFLQEARAHGSASGDASAGIALTMVGMFAASVGNVMQASAAMRARPIEVTLAWGMAYGTAANAICASILHGGPVAEARITYWLGLVYLGPVASSLAFTLYFRLLREVGPERAAYVNVLFPIIAMLLSTVFEKYIWACLAVLGAGLALAGLIIALGSPTADAQSLARVR